MCPGIEAAFVFGSQLGMMPPDSEPPSGALPGNLDYLLEQGRLKRAVATRESVAALWQKAAAALALLATYGLRTGSGRGHHEVASAVAATLGGEDLEDLLPDSTEIRALRHDSMYDPRMATVEDRDHALDWMRRTLPAIRRAVLDESPDLADRLQNYPPKRRNSTR